MALVQYLKMKGVEGTGRVERPGIVEGTRGCRGDRGM
jgi:hypothetical protein